MKPPESDPRLLEKNFAMPMASAAPSPVELPGVPAHRNDGYTPPSASIPSYGGRSTHEVVKIPSRRTSSSSAAPPLWLQSVSSSKFKCTPGTVRLVAVGLTAQELAFTGKDYVFILATVVFGNTTSEDTITVSVVQSSQSIYPGAGEVGPDGFTSAYPLGHIENSGVAVNYGTGGNLGVEAFGSAVFWWKW